MDTNTEWYTSDGRIDVLVRVLRYIYLLELKLDRPVTEAMDQIERKDYARQFEFDGRPVIKIGIEFSTLIRDILSWRLLSSEGYHYPGCGLYRPYSVILNPPCRGSSRGLNPQPAWGATSRRRALEHR